MRGFRDVITVCGEVYISSEAAVMFATASDGYGGVVGATF